MNFLLAITTILALGHVSSSPLNSSNNGTVDSSHHGQDDLGTLRRTQWLESSLTCSGSNGLIIVQIRTDNNGSETSWELRDSNNVTIEQVSSSTYKSNQEYEEIMCLPVDNYTLAIRDVRGDGICCERGNGSFSVLHEIDGTWTNLISVEKFTFESIQTFQVDQSSTSIRAYSNNDFVRNIALGGQRPTKPPTHRPTRRPSRPTRRPRNNRPTRRTRTRPANKPTKRPTKRPTERPTTRPTQRPTKYPTTSPTSSPTKNPVKDPAFAFSTRSIPVEESCNSSQSRIRIEIRTDKFGQDTSWKVTDSQGNSLFASNKAYGKYELDNREICLKKDSIYNFILRDSVGDGMCCSYGEGYYKVFLLEGSSWTKIIGGGSFRQKEMKHIIYLKERATLTDRDKDWLASHNTRRKEWHEKHGKTFVPLKWSDALKDESQVWAEKLLDSCGKGMHHDPNVIYGENVAGNSGDGSWGSLQPTDKIVNRFVEREIDKPWPKNSHLTQVLWRASKYVGCAEASKPYGANGMCRTQVCRYSRAGNCNMAKYKNGAAQGNTEWWLKPMLLDDSPCGPDCPPDGCY